MNLWFTRARLRRDTAATGSLARLLVPDGGPAREAAAHRLIWALFADSVDRRRDFLWREEGPGRFLALSSRPPTTLPDLFEVETKPFEPVLAGGDRLGFSLRANPVISRADGSGRSKRHDVVMDALHHLPAGDRASARLAVATEAGCAWLARQGEAHGFAPLGNVGVDGYEPVRVARDKGPPARFSRLDFQGLLEVVDPEKFMISLAAGLGRARAFGCGLMLIRRA